jgi:succinate dehydrogenase / fumarate reductase iron-sulfur subunit
MTLVDTPATSGAKGEAPTISLTLHVWRQRSHEDVGEMVTYPASGISIEMSFLEMLDVVNEGLIKGGQDPIAFDHDCREGICGSCGMMINGIAHGPQRATTTCQLHMRFFKDGEDVWIEPWRAEAFPVVRDLIVDRSAFDKIIQAGGYITAPTGPMPTLRSRRRTASAAGPAWPPARTRPRCSSPRPRPPTWACCPRDRLSGMPGCFP